MKKCSAIWAGSLALVSAGAWVLYTYAPTGNRFYPQCVFKMLTGLDCPGCGTTRALHHLLHGRFEQAFMLNPLLFVLMLVVLCALPSLIRGEQPRFITRPWFGWTALVVMTGYWIVRNTPFYPY